MHQEDFEQAHMQVSQGPHLSSESQSADHISLLCRYGLLPPELIESQRKSYTSMVDAQLEQGLSVLDAQYESAKKMLRAQANRHIEQYAMNVELEVVQQQSSLKQQREVHLTSLRQQAMERHQEMESQASMMILNFEQRKVQSTIDARQEQMEVNHSNLWKRMEEGRSKSLGLNTGSMRF